MKTITVVVLSIALGAILSCRKPGDIDGCISVDKDSANVNEVITVSNCGESLPSRVTITLNWGDGSKETSGQTGSHSYSQSGTYTIKVMANGDPISERVGNKDKLEKTIVIR